MLWETGSVMGNQSSKDWCLFLMYGIGYLRFGYLGELLKSAECLTAWDLPGKWSGDVAAVRLADAAPANWNLMLSGAVLIRKQPNVSCCNASDKG